MVQFLLSRGANPNAQNIEERTTPLHDAATAGNLAVVELLVKGGAKLETKNNVRYHFDTNKIGWINTIV
jgi:ankyrin repeat protein